MGKQTISVGIGEMQVARRGPTTLVCYGLGSCVGIALRDPVTGLCSLSHVVLPDSTFGQSANGGPAKFADRAIPAALAAMKRLGAKMRTIEARIAGGAQMLKGLGLLGDRLDVGSRNIEAVEAILAAHEIPLIAADVGGSHGRTMQLHADSGLVIISTVGFGTKTI